MSYKLSEIAQEIGIELNAKDRDITGLNSLKNASDQEISFINSDRYASELTNTKAAAVLMSSKYLNILPNGTVPLITDNPYLDLAFISRLFRYEQGADEYEPSIGAGCKIAKSARFGNGVVLADSVTVMPGAYIGDFTFIDSDSVIYPNVSIYHHTRIGKRCIIHSGAVIGADGYGYASKDDGSHIKIYQNGNVVLEDNVEVGANSTIDRAVFGSTVIGAGTKIDNLVQVAHNCKLGKNCMLVCQTALAGSTVLGDSVTMGGQSGATGHLQIGSNATIASRAGATKSLEGNKVYGGFPAVEHSIWLKMQAKLLHLIKKNRK